MASPWQTMSSVTGLTMRDRGARRTITGAKWTADRKSTRLNSSHSQISYAVFCLKKKISLHQNTSLSSRDTLLTCSELLFCEILEACALQLTWCTLLTRWRNALSISHAVVWHQQ